MHRRALLASVVSMAGINLRHFSRHGWRFLGSEVIVANVALDLLWQRGSRLEVDEVKSSVTTPEQWRERALAQAQAQAVAGRAEYGDGCAGVRVTPLAWPKKAFFVAS